MEQETSEASNFVRVQLVLKHQKCQHKEVIKRVTKAHEVVEVDGFVFRRKKRAPQAQETPAQQQQKQEQQGQQPAPAASADTAPLAPHTSPSALKPGLQLTPGAAAHAAKGPATAAAANAADPAAEPAFNPFARSNKLLHDHEVAAAAPAATQSAMQAAAPAAQPAVGLASPHSVAGTAPGPSNQSPAPRSTAAAGMHATAMDVDGAAPPNAAAAQGEAAQLAAAEAAAAQQAEAEAAEAEAGGAEAEQAAGAGVQTPLRFSISSAELTYLVQWLLTTELKKVGALDPDQLVAAAAGISQRFADVVAQHMDAQQHVHGSQHMDSQQGQQHMDVDGLQERQEGRGAGAFGGLAALPYQINKLKRALLDKKEKLLQEEAAWQQLQAKYQQLEQQLAAPAEPAAVLAAAITEATGPAAATEAADAVAAEPAAMAGGATAGAALAGDGPAAMVAPAPGAATTASTPEAAPAADAGDVTDAAAAAADKTATPDGAAAAAGTTAPAAGAVLKAPPGPATAARNAALQTWGVQVEALCALVLKMEELVDKARAASSTLQAEYHHDKLKMYPHVNSPVYLIKSIIKPAA